MAVALISCYFVPLVLFFLAQIALPKSCLACVLGIAAVSICTLFLHFMIRLQKRPILVVEQATGPKEVIQKSAPTVLKEPLICFEAFVKGFPVAQMPNYKARVDELNRALQQQKLLLDQELYTRDVEAEDLEKNSMLLQQRLAEKEELIAKQQAELDNLKFEMYTLLRIDSYMVSKQSVEAQELATASF